MGHKCVFIMLTYVYYLLYISSKVFHCYRLCKLFLFLLVFGENPAYSSFTFDILLVFWLIYYIFISFEFIHCYNL